MSADIPLAAHATFVVVTLEHTLRKKSAGWAVDVLAPGWKPWWSRLDGDGIESAKNDARFFLDYVRGVVAPEAAPVSQPVQGDQVLHLTLSPDRLAALASVELVPRHGEARPTPLRTLSVDLVLYPTGVGFLVLKMQLAGEGPTLGALIEANGQLRTLRPLSRTWVLAHLRTPKDVEGRTMRELLESLVAGMGRLSVSDEPRAQVICFACADVPATAERGAFPTPEDRVLYELTTSVGLDRTLTDATWAPGADQVDDMVTSHRYAPWRAWRALCLKEVFGVLATEVLPFTTRALPRVLEGVYLPLYLYALHQRVMLERFSRELVARVATGRLDVHAVRRHVDAYEEFRHRYWLSEVTGRPMGGELYRKIQHGLELGALNDLAARATEEVRAFYEERRGRRVSLLLGVLTFAFGPFGTAVQIANFAVPDHDRAFRSHAIVTAVVLLAIWGMLGALWVRTKARR